MTEPSQSQEQKKPTTPHPHRTSLNRSAVKLALLALLNEFSQETRNALALLLELETEEQQAEKQVPTAPNGGPRKSTPKRASR